MFKPLINILLVLSIVFSVGCSTNSKKIWFQSTDTLVIDGNFKKALSQLEAENKTDTKLYKKIKRSDHSKAMKMITQVQTAINLKHWGEAREQLTLLTENHSWKNEFRALKKVINRSSANEQRMIETQLRLTQANLLNSKLAQYDFDIRSHNNNHGWSFTKSFLRSEKDQLAKSLYSLSIQALAMQDYESAQKTYDQALQLNSDLQGFKIPKTINTGPNKSNQKTILNRQKTLLSELDIALSEEDFSIIVDLQKILSNAPFKGREVNAALKRSSTIRMKQAQLLDKQADSIYRHGDISKAISLWQQANHLAPSLPSLQDKLARAGKVQSKLIQLRQKN